MQVVLLWFSKGWFSHVFGPATQIGQIGPLLEVFASPIGFRGYSVGRVDLKSPNENSTLYL